MTIPARSSYLRIVPPQVLAVTAESDDALGTAVGFLNGLAIIIPAWAVLATLIYWVLP